MKFGGDSPELDAIDLQIISLLQEHGRIPLVKLGEHVGLSAPSVNERVKKLEDGGVIIGYHATLSFDPSGIAMSGPAVPLWSGSPPIAPAMRLSSQVRRALVPLRGAPEPSDAGCAIAARIARSAAISCISSAWRSGACVSVDCSPSRDAALSSMRKILRGSGITSLTNFH